MGRHIVPAQCSQPPGSLHSFDNLGACVTLLPLIEGGEPIAAGGRNAQSKLSVINFVLGVPVKNAVRAWWDRLLSKPVNRLSCAVAPAVESLEGRMLLSATGPQVAAIIADNRGQVKLTLTQTLNPATVNSSTVRILTAGPDGKLDTADDVAVHANLQLSGKTLYITANTPANKLYRIQLLSTIKGSNGRALVGNTGRGGIGGNFDEETVAPNFIAYMNTPAGFIQVVLDSNTPITNQNFVNYANSGAWDGTIIHRNASSVDPTTLAVTKSNFIIQAGGFRVNNGLFDVVPAASPITNEPVNHNVKFTIAMAKLGGDPNSATNQFFFNLGDNSSNLDSQNGGFTAFGTVTDSSSQAVINALNNNYAIAPASSATLSSTATTAGLFNSTNTSAALLAGGANLGSGQTAGTGLFDNLPVQSIPAIIAAKNLNALRDAVIIYRVSFLMSILPTATAGVISPAVARPAATAPVFSTTAIATPAVTAASTGGSLFAAELKKDLLA
jgi:cyclophilin family peptidyl-prolyl cis-trans isomerase